MRITWALGPLGCETVMEPLEVTVGTMRMVLLPVVKLKTACVCPSGFTTVIPVGDSCIHMISLLSEVSCKDKEGKWVRRVACYQCISGKGSSDM